MATLGKRIDPEEEEETLEQLEGFDDFTLASSWERFISDIEAVCRLWMVDGPKNLVYKGAEQLSFPKRLYKVKSELKYGSKNYCLEYYFEVDSHGKFVEWDDDLHNLQVLFGIKEFLVIAPISVSKVILDAPEASKLLSSVAIALSNCESVWPALVPVHDPSRKAYIGIQNMGMIFTRRFETDRIGSQVPIRLMHLEGLYELFVSKFALSLTDISARILNVHFTMKLTYRTPLYDDGDDMQGTETPEENTVAEPHLRAQWDEDCSWSEWYSAEDPVRGFELIAVWSRKTVGSSFEMAEIENASSIDAEKWIMFPVLSSYMMDDASGNPVGFASQLDLLVKAFDICFDVKFMEDFLSAENSGPGNSKPANSIPSPTVVDRVIKDLFHDGVQIPNNPKREHSNSRAVKGAPLESLFAQFCLYALWFGDCNIRAIAVLWIEFVREVRWCWEESQTLPRVVTDGGIDLSTCIIHQKLQMLAICIERKNMKQNYTESRDHTPDAKDKYHDEVSQFQSHHYKEKQGKRYDSGSKKAMRSEIERADTSASAESEHVDCVRRGSPGIESSMMLLRSYKYMNAPLTQEDPIMTEDMHEERLRAIEAFGDSSSFSGQLEKDILSSDMSAFKAANSDAIFEDFIRWHSPGDWEDEQFEANNKSSANEVGGSKVNWPPRGKLSQRMSERGNSWRQIWNDSPPLPASMQKPLLDPIREGEKIVHYLETLKPDQLLAQMICASFKASLDTLNQTSYGNLKQMKTKIGQLYLTIASTLKHFKGSNMPDKTEFVGDLRRLCIVFGHVEKLLFLAASIHRKLSDAPRLAEAIFNDCFTFYLPKFGTGSENICYDKKFDSKQQVRIKERDAVERLFPPPTANQSWRKVLSMGNLLNGHEPVLREIIFSVHDKVGSGRYGANASQGSADEEEIETHRMYICGTSNDLQVALSVISWD